MENTVFHLSVFLLLWSCSLSAQQKGVAINRPDLETGLVLDVSGQDGGNRLGVRFSPLSAVPQTGPAGTMYFDTGLGTYRQWTGTAWRDMMGLFQTNSSGQAAYSGTVRIDGALGISTDPDRALDVSGAIRSTGNLEANGIITGFINSDTRVTTPRVNTDYVNVAENLPLDEALHLRVVGSSYFRSNSGTQSTFIDQLVIRNSSGNYSLISTSGSNVSANSFSGTPPSPSDANLKDDLQPVTSALAKVKGLNGVTYSWNERAKRLFSDAATANLVRGPEQSEAEFQQQQTLQAEQISARFNGRETGLIAQELRAVLPEAVVEGEDGYLRVKYGHLAGLFVEAIKEQQTIIEAQAERIRKLEAAQAGVLERLARLEEGNSVRTLSGPARSSLDADSSTSTERD